MSWFTQWYINQSNSSFVDWLTLSANNITTEEILIPFRIVKSLPINELIIGLQDVRKHKLTKVFSHLFEEKDDEQNLSEQRNIETNNESEKFERSADDESINKVKKILDEIEDDEMKSLLKTWIFGLASCRSSKNSSKIKRQWSKVT